MWKFFAETNSNRWIDQFGDILYFYNNKFHITIGMTPTQARLPENYNLILSEMGFESDFYQ